MELGLSGKIGLVTGASRGIGRAIALTLAREGMDLALAARDMPALETLAREITALGRKVLIYAGDLRLPEAPDGFRTAAIDRFGRIDLVVCNAGATRRGDFFSLSESDWMDGFELKFHAHVRLTRAVWSDLMASSGRLLFIIGIGGRSPGAEFTIGGAVNAALMNFTKAMAERGITDGVRVCAINPGSIRTDRLAARIRATAAERGLTEEAAALELAKSFRVARFGRPEEIGAMVAFLASEQAGYCQGAIVDVDGGAIKTL